MMPMSVSPSVFANFDGSLVPVEFVRVPTVGEEIEYGNEAFEVIKVVHQVGMDRKVTVICKPVWKMGTH